MTEKIRTKRETESENLEGKKCTNETENGRV